MIFLERIIEAVKKDYAEHLVSVDQGGQLPVLVVTRDAVVRILTLLRKEFDFESLTSETASDKVDRIVMIYHLFSTPHRQKLVVKTDLPRENPKIMTVEGIWRAANWYEREIFDLFGVKFIGHSDLFRILNPPDWEGHPLLKDYQPAPDYHGMKIEH